MSNDSNQIIWISERAKKLAAFGLPPDTTDAMIESIALSFGLPADADPGAIIAKARANTRLMRKVNEIINFVQKGIK